MGADENEIYGIKQDIGILEKRVSRHDIDIAISEKNIERVQTDLQTIRSDTRWILRIIISTIVVGLMALIINT